MDLKQIKGIGPAKQEKLKAAGITTIDHLARADAEGLAVKTGLPLAQVKDLKHRAAALALIEDLKGIGPATLEALSEAGARSVRELYAASAEWLAAEMKAAQAKLAGLKAEAESLARHVAVEAKTPQGRARLAHEGKTAAQKAARSAQANGKTALAAAQRQSELALAKAQELREKAPQALHQAQAAVQDAERRLKATVERTETVLRAEAQKAKARTERVVEQTRARFNRAA
jgi:predicted flap endonuclease-1-like 5' DNA nuclease